MVETLVANGDADDYVATGAESAERYANEAAIERWVLRAEGIEPPTGTDVERVIDVRGNGVVPVLGQLALRRSNPLFIR